MSNTFRDAAAGAFSYLIPIGSPIIAGQPIMRGGLAEHHQNLAVGRRRFRSGGAPGERDEHRGDNRKKWPRLPGASHGRVPSMGCAI